MFSRQNLCFHLYSLYIDSLTAKNPEKLNIAALIKLSLSISSMFISTEKLFISASVYIFSRLSDIVNFG